MHAISDIMSLLQLRLELSGTAGRWVENKPLKGDPQQ